MPKPIVPVPKRKSYYKPRSQAERERRKALREAIRHTQDTKLVGK